MEEIIKKVIEESDSNAVPVTPTDTALQEKMKQEAEKEKELLEQAIKHAVRATTPVEVSEEPSVETEEPEAEPEEEGKELEETEDLDQNDATERNEPEGSDETNVEVNGHASDSAKEENSVDECAEEVGSLKIEENRSDVILPKTLPPLKVPEERPWSEGDNVYSQVQIEVSPIELEKRQNYLRQQRDRILAMKKQERARRFSTSEEVIGQARPKSARAARKILREESTEVDPQTLAFRKTLAAKLRSEVVDKTD